MTAKQLQSIIHLLRKEQISWTTLTLGTFHLDGAVDLKLADARSKLPGSKPEPRASMFEEYGKILLEQPGSPVDNVPDEAKLED